MVIPSTKSGLSATLVAVLALIVLAGSAGAIDRVDEREFIDHGNNVRTDGQTVVWESRRNIYAERPATGERREIVQGNRWMHLPDVSGDLIVWREGELAGGSPPAGGDPQIWGMYWVEKEPFLIYDFQSFSYSRRAGPAVSGTNVVWIDGNGGVMARDVATMEEPRHIAETWDHDLRGGIDIEGSTVVWGSEWNDGNTWQLATVDLGNEDPETNVIIEYANVEEADPVGLTSFDIDEGRVIYDNPLGQVVVRDIDTGHPQFRGGQNSSFPVLSLQVLDGRYLFWSESYSTRDVRRIDLVGFDLESNSQFTIVEGGTNAPAGAENGMLAWVRGVRGSSPLADVRIFFDPITVLLPTAERIEPEDDNPNRIFFPETGHNLIFGFKNFWEESGGLPVFGYPLTEEFDEQNPELGRMLTVQYFERQRFEYHPEHSGTPYEVQLGRLGIAEARERGLLEEDAIEPISTDPEDVEACEYFHVTEHTVCDVLDYWQSNGLEFDDPGISERESVALFGYPVTPAFEDPDTGLVTQYFERARFEYHPDSPEEHQVLLGHLGHAIIEKRDW